MEINKDLYLDTLKNELIGNLVRDNINEERGVNKDYLPIANELYDALLKYGSVKLIDYGYEYELHNYKPLIDTFFESISIECYINVMGSTSSFDVRMGEPQLHKNMKLNNIKIKLAVSSDSNNIKIPDKEEFIINFCHEFHHAYRYWNIINKNNGSLSGSEQILKDRNANIQRVKNSFNFKYTQMFDYCLKSFLEYAYFANSDEINAFSAEIYEFLRQHPEISRGNVMDRLDEIPSYESVSSLRDAIVFTDSISRIDNEKDKDSAMYAAQSVCNDILRFGNVSKQHALLVLRQFFAKAYEKQERQFFKVLRNALCDLETNDKKNVREMIKNITISKQMCEILNKTRIL